MGVITINFEEFSSNRLFLNQGPTSVKTCTDFQIPGHLNTSIYYLPPGEVWATATILYTDITLLTLAANFWYSDGSIARKWNGVNFVSGNVAC